MPAQDSACSCSAPTLTLVEFFRTGPAWPSHHAPAITVHPCTGRGCQAPAPTPALLAARRSAARFPEARRAPLERSTDWGRTLLQAEQKARQPPKQGSMNAFQLINASLDLSAMFDRRAVTPRCAPVASRWPSAGLLLQGAHATCRTVDALQCSSPVGFCVSRCLPAR